MWRICLTSIPIHYVYNLVMCCFFFNYLCLLSFSVYSFFEIVQETATPEIKSKSNKMVSNQIKQKLQLNNWAINGTAQPCQWILVFTFWRSLVSNKKQIILNPYDLKRNWENPLKIHMYVLVTSIVLCALETTAVSAIQTTSGGFLHLVVLCTCVIFLKKIFCLELLKLSG